MKNFDITPYQNMIQDGSKLEVVEFDDGFDIEYFVELVLTDGTRVAAYDVGPGVGRVTLGDGAEIAPDYELSDPDTLVNIDPAKLTIYRYEALAAANDAIRGY